MDLTVIQLLFINGFVKNGKIEIKQVPFICFTMLRRRVSDYYAVLLAAISLVKSVVSEGEGPKVGEICSDFEWAM